MVWLVEEPRYRLREIGLERGYEAIQTDIIGKSLSVQSDFVGI